MKTRAEQDATLGRKRRAPRDCGIDVNIVMGVGEKQKVLHSGCRVRDVGIFGDPRKFEIAAIENPRVVLRLSSLPVSC